LSAHTRIQLRYCFAFRFSYLIQGVRGRPLLSPSPALIVVSTPPLTSANPSEK
jgi:hypothetical protein